MCVCVFNCVYLPTGTTGSWGWARAKAVKIVRRRVNLLTLMLFRTFFLWAGALFWLGRMSWIVWGIFLLILCNKFNRFGRVLGLGVC